MALFDGILADYPVFRDPAQGMWLHILRSQGLLIHWNNLVRSGRRAEALETFRQVETGPQPRAGAAYDVACLLAVLANAAPGPVKEDLCRRSLEWLKSAAKTGYPANEAQVEHIRTKDEDLAALRSRADFQEWAKTLTPSPKKAN
jgi:hypothetical protein